MNYLKTLITILTIITVVLFLITVYFAHLAFVQAHSKFGGFRKTPSEVQRVLFASHPFNGYPIEAVKEKADAEIHSFSNRGSIRTGSGMYFSHEEYIEMRKISIQSPLP